MKKVLLATTVLAMTATVAAAEVTLSGNARMGVVYNGNAASNKLQFTSRVRASISMSSETDGGLAFGGSFDVHNAGPASTGNSGSVFISGAFGKLEMGDVVGAAESVVGDLPEIGFTDIAANDVTFITGDGAVTSVNNPVALYTYSTGALTFAVSMNDGATNAGGALAPVDATDEYALGAKYTVDAYSFALGYEVSKPLTGASAKHLVLGGEATFGAATVKAVYGDGSGAINGFSQFGLGVTYKMDALTVKAMVNQQKIDAGSAAAATFGVSGKATGYGIGAAYDLGGGATLEGGISDNDAAGTKAIADLGLKFKF